MSLFTSPHLPGLAVFVAMHYAFTKKVFCPGHGDIEKSKIATPAGALRMYNNTLFCPVAHGSKSYILFVLF